MKKYSVTVEIFHENGTRDIKTVVVEAGNKRLASVRALREISKNEKYANLFKGIKSVEAVA